MVKLKKWDVSEHLDSEEKIVAFLNSVAELNDPKLMQAALGEVAKARGMTQIAREVGVTRESLYTSLSEGGNPSFQTISKVMAALGARINVQPATA